MKNYHAHYVKIVRDMPHDLHRVVGLVLTDHIGKKMSISRQNLRLAVSRLEFGAEDRQIREAIKQLRRRGWLICSSAGSGGYFLAADLAEFIEFDRQEFESKITDMSITRNAMKKAAEEQLGNSYQMELI
ncbi:MAG: hypothetical protein JEZ06_00335 [Anaerolineaceae bacterium]|nr:hypothetical protein [Anaerolineaceae bacterium]